MTWRILVASPFGIGGEYNGPAVLLNRLMEQLRGADDIAVDVAYSWVSSNRAVRAPWADHHYPLCRKRAGSMHRIQQLIWVVRLSMLVMFTGRRYDLIHFQGAYVENLLCALLARTMRIPYCLLPVLEDGDLSRNAPWRRVPVIGTVLSATVADAAAGFCLSAGIREDFVRDGLTRVFDLGNPVSPGFFRQPRRESPASPCLGFVGKLGDRKRPHLVLECLADLVEQGISATAVFVGPFESDDYERRFRDLIAVNSLDGRVRLLGYIPDASSAMKEDMSVLLLPSASEGLPGAVCEALAAGLPVIVTPVGAMGDLVAASAAGLIVKPDVADVTRAVKEALSPARYVELSTNAVKYATSFFTQDAVARTYLKALPKRGES